MLNWKYSTFNHATFHTQTDIINIRSNKEQLQKVEIYNMTGRLLSTKDVNANIYDLNIANYSSGIYLLRVFGQNNDTINTKIVKK